MGSPVVWFELRTRDVARAKEFYGMLFGWDFAALAGPEDDYWLVSTTEGTVSGGFREDPDAGDGQAITLFVQVEELEAAMSMATALGAQVEQDATEIGEAAGRYAILHDPNGCRFGMWSAS